MIDLTITRQMLGTVLQSWFHNIKNAEQAKAEILALFSEEPGDGYTWSEQDIWEQSRKIINVGTGCNMILWVSRGALPLCSPWTSHP